MKGIGYIYLTTNLVNGKRYVGQHLATEFDTKYKGSGTYIKNALNKYGWDNFSCEIICWCATQIQLNEAEDNYIKLLDTMYPKGYNLKGGGANGKHSEEARKNNSKSCKKHWECKENREKMSEIKKRFWENIESRDKQREISLNRWENIETRKKASIAQKKRFENEEERIKCGKGKKRGTETEETRKKKSLSHKKRFENPEERKKVSERNKNYYANEENRKKMSEILLNTEHTKKTSKKVLQYTLDGEFVKEWCSLHEIKRELGFECSPISDCCKGKHKYAYKYIWKFPPQSIKS